MTRRIALVGAGAISRTFYLPALTRLRGRLDELWIVDPSRSALDLAVKGVAAKTVSRLDQIDSELDLVIVAAPNSLHAPIATEALERNANVFVEKPFVSIPSDGEKLISLAAAKGKLVAVNQTRRYYPALAALRSIVASGELGRLASIEHFEGVKLDWPFESGTAFAPGAFRTGVIMDLAVHVLDYYHALLSPAWSFDTAIHDGFVGPEGLADIQVKAGTVPVRVRLSRYQLLRNTARLSFERGLVEFDVFDWNAVTVMPAGGKPRRLAGPDPLSDFASIGDRLLADVLKAIETGAAPRCTAADSLPIIRLLDDIYTGATLYPDAVGAV